MKVKYKKPFFVAIIINLALGAFLIINGVLEFCGVLQTMANNNVTTMGVQSSHLIFVSGVLTFLSGLYSAINYKTLKNLTLQLFLGVVALAWPTFVSMVLFLSQFIICIRLAPTLLTSLYYVITILIVKIGNEEFNKRVKLSGNIKIGEKRKRNVDIIGVLKGNKRTKISADEEDKKDKSQKKRRHKQANISEKTTQFMKKLSPKRKVKRPRKTKRMRIPKMRRKW